MALKKILAHVQDGIKSELKKAQKIEGEKLQSFINTFRVSEDAKLYYTPYNLIIADPISYEELLPFLRPETLIMEIKVISFNAYLWVYEITNDSMFDQFLNDPEIM